MHESLCYSKTPANHKMQYETLLNFLALLMSHLPRSVCRASRGEASPDVVGEQTIVRGSGLKGSVLGPPITPPFLSVRGAWNFTNNRTVYKIMTYMYSSYGNAH